MAGQEAGTTAGVEMVSESLITLIVAIEWELDHRVLTPQMGKYELLEVEQAKQMKLKYHAKE
jgi:hypothetical protein